MHQMKIAIFGDFLVSSFFRICTDYGDSICKSPYSVWMREKEDQENTEYGHFLRSAGLYTAQKMKYSIKDFFSKCVQICSFLRIWSHKPWRY